MKTPPRGLTTWFTDLSKSLRPPLHMPFAPTLYRPASPLPCKTHPDNPRVFKSWIFHCKRKENKTLVHTLRLLLLSLGASWLSPSLFFFLFSFFALRAPPNLVPPGPRVAPVHRCPHLVVMAPCCTDTVPPQGFYTLYKRLQRSRYHPNLTIRVV